MITQDQKVSIYLLWLAVAHIDGEFSSDEIAFLKDLDKVFGVNTHDVYMFMQNFDPQKHINTLKSMSIEDKKYFRDWMIQVIMSDRVIHPAEQAFYMKICDQLNIDPFEKFNMITGQ